MKRNNDGQILLILGVLGALLGGAAAIILLPPPQMTRNVSLNEAMIGIIAGAVLLGLSFIFPIAGLILVIEKKRQIEKSRLN